MRNTRKGFTLVEVMVTLAIIGITIFAFSQFLVSNMKNYSNAQDIVAVQDAAQKVAERLAQDIMESSGVSTVDDDTGTDIIGNAPTTPVPITNLTLTRCEMTYSYDAETKRLTVTDASNVTKLSASNITSIQLAPIPNGPFNDLEKCKGLSFVIEAEVNGKTIRLTNEIYYRNVY